MHFPYLILPEDKSFTYRPFLPVKYKYNGQETEPLLALVDSGADYSFVGMKVAMQLGIDLTNVKPLPIVGFNGSQSECFPKDILVNIAGKDVLLTVYFGGSLTQNFLPLLGQNVFFDKAKVTFERYNKSFQIQWKHRN